MKGYLKTGIAVLVFLLMTMGAASAQDTVKLIPSDTTVAPGGQFDLNVYITDDTTKSALVNFTFDPAQVSVAGTSTYDVGFDFTNTTITGSNYAKFLGVATSPVDISTDTKVATFTFDVSDTLTDGETINFSVQKANINGSAANVEVTNVTVEVGVTETPTPTPTCKDPLPEIASADITMEFKDYKEKVSDCKLTYDYGDTIKVEATYPATSDSTQWLEITDVDSGDRIKRYPLDDDGVDTVSIPSTDYAPATKFGFKLYSSQAGTTLNTVALGYTIEAEVVEPQISLALDNPSNKIAKGDIAKFEGEITTTGYNWTLNGPYDKTNHFSGVASEATVDADSTTIGATSMQVTAYDHDIDVSIPTKAILDAGGSTGTYKFKVWNAAHPDTTASVEFKLEGVSVTPVADKDTIKKGEDLTVSGTTNMAETQSEYDETTGGENKVFIAVYNSTSAETTDFVAGFWDTVEEDGTFSKDITFELGWESDTTYEVDVIAMSNYDTTKSSTNTSGWAANYEDWADYYDDESVYVEVEDPVVNFDMADVTFTKGESDISFAGTTSLGAGEAIYIPKEDIDAFIEPTYATVNPSGPVGESLRALAGTDGTWETVDLDVRDDASIGSYTVHAKIINPDGEELDDDSVNINIVKQELDASIDKTTVAKGGEITINGSTTVSSVYIFASETGLFEQTVTENPTESNYTIGSQGQNDLEVPVDDDTFTKTLDVRTDADTGSYMLYVYAPSSDDYIKTAEDAQKMFSLTITDIGFTEVPETVKMVQGQDKDLDFKVPETAENDVYVEFTFSGAGIKVDANEYNTFHKTPDDDGLIELTLEPFYYDGPAGDELLSDYQAECAGSSCLDDGDCEDTNLLPVGTYTLEAELFYNDGESITDVKVPVQVVQPTLDVEMPSEVSHGNTLEVTVKTNRGENYDGIYVVLDRGLNPVAQQVNTDENGTAVASFETLGLGTGTYKVFIRDTMDTLSCGDEGIEDFYDWDPATEKSDWASDDMYTVKTVSVVEEAVTTPTPTPTKEVTETPTKEVTETPTKEVTETPTQAPTTPPTTETPPPATPTPTPEPSPGFELVFAVAGLLAVAYLLRRR